jgi:hypothetical protein
MRKASLSRQHSNYIFSNGEKGEELSCLEGGKANQAKVWNQGKSYCELGRMRTLSK